MRPPGKPIPEDVADFLASVDSIGKLIVYTPQDGPSRRAIANPAAGLGLADEISASLRQDTRDGPKTLHLFQGAPPAVYSGRPPLDGCHGCSSTTTLDLVGATFRRS
jgi:hypothetical protein